MEAEEHNKLGKVLHCKKNMNEFTTDAERKRMRIIVIIAAVSSQLKPLARL